MVLNQHYSYLDWYSDSDKHVKYIFLLVSTGFIGVIVVLNQYHNFLHWGRSHVDSMQLNTLWIIY